MGAIAGKDTRMHAETKLPESVFRFSGSWCIVYQGL